MTDPAETEAPPAPKRSKPRLVDPVQPDLEKLEADVKAPAVTATMPIIKESTAKRQEWHREINEVAGEIHMIDASEAQAEADFNAVVRLETDKREAVRAGQAARRADLMLVHEGLAAALRASGGDTEAQTEAAS